MILRALVTRPLARRPVRFLATALGVAAGVAAVVATLAASRAALASVRDGTRELSGGAALEIVRPGGLTLAQLERLGELAPLARASPIVEEMALAPRLSDAVRLLGIDAFSSGLARELGAGPRREAGDRRDSGDGGDAPARDRESRADEKATGSGSDASSDTRRTTRASDADATLDARETSPGDAFLALVRGDGAWISEALARDLGVARGGTLELEVRASPVRVAVVGTFATDERSTALARTVVVDVALAQELTGRLDRIDRIALSPRGTSDPAELAERVRPLLEPGAQIVTPSERASQTGGLAASLEFNLTALSGISLLVGAVLVATTLATSIVQRARTLALLRSLGASSFQIGRAILVEALALGVVGGALGVGLGFVLARLLAGSMRQTVAAVVQGAAQTPIHLQASDVALGIGLGTATALAAAVLPLVEGARTPPIQALRAESPRYLSIEAIGFHALALLGCLVLGYELVEEPAWRGLPVAALLGSLAILAASFFAYAPAIDALARLASRAPRLPAPLALAASTLASGRRRSAWAAAAVGTAVALSISIATMVHSFRGSVVQWSDEALRAHLSVRPTTAVTGVPVGGLDPAVLEAAREALPGAAFDPHHLQTASMRSEAVSLASADFDVIAPRGGFVFVDGADPRAVLERARRERALLVNEAFALRFDVAAGDTLSLDVVGVPVVRGVAGVFRDYGDSRGTVVLDRPSFEAFFPDDAPRTLAVYLEDGTSVPEARARLASALAPRYQVEVLETREIRAKILEVFERTFAITSALQGVAAIVAVIAVLSVLYALVDERRVDLALSSAIGASRAQIRAQVAAQAGLLGLLGALAGACAGLAIGVVLVVVVQTQSFGWTLAFSMPWGALAGTIVAVAAACLAAGLVPAHAVSRARLADALRTE